MFHVGDYVIYENSGVCKIEAIGLLDIQGMSKDKEYYTLRPEYIRGSTIFNPVGNEKVIMRPIISKEEALALIDEMKTMECLVITDERRREIDYKEALHKCDCRELVKLIKTSYLRKQSRLKEGKKVAASDDRYFNLAEEQLYGEMAVALGMNKEETKVFVHQKLEK